MRQPNVRIVAAEIIGTFIIVFLGTGSIMANEATSGGIAHLGICIIWGFAVFLAIVVAERIGQGHFNPAVTIAVALKEKISASVILLRIASQVIGALAASTLLRYALPTITTLGQTLPNLPVWMVFLIETVISFGLMATIEFSVLKKLKLTNAALIIGGYVALAAFVAGPYTGASMNPARTLGPAIVGGIMPALWLYMIAPSLGMVLAVSIIRQRSEIP
ncbi:MAG TPA: aquaporin [Candidatus Kapabacteria bacterium]|nr:aquaporin [Candidatus Kapabacteria bacterium]